MPVSVWQTVLNNFHTPLVRSPADRTKVVTMAALLKFAGFETFKSLTFSKLSNSFSSFRSWKSPTASSSAEHKAAARCICPIDNSSTFQLGFFFPAGGSGFLLGEMIARYSSCDDMSEGWVREGMGFELGPRVVPFQQTEIWGGGFYMGGDIFWKNVPVGVKEVKEGPFVGEETAMLFLEVETVVEVVEVVVKVMVEMGEVTVFERRGLPQDEFFPGTFFSCPFLPVPSPL